MLIANQPDVTVLNTPNVRVLELPEVQLTSNNSVNIANHPDVQVVNRPSVEVVNTPTVTVTNEPTVHLAGTPTFQIQGNVQLDPDTTLAVNVLNNPSVNVANHPDIQVVSFRYKTQTNMVWTNVHFNFFHQFVQQLVTIGSWVIDCTGYALAELPATPGLYYHTSGDGVPPFDRWYGIRITPDSMGEVLLTTYSPLMSFFVNTWGSVAGDAGRGDIVMATPY